MPTSSRQHSPFRCRTYACVHPSCLSANHDQHKFDNLLSRAYYAARFHAMQGRNAFSCVSLLKLAGVIWLGHRVEEAGAVELIWLALSGEYQPDGFSTWDTVRFGHAHALSLLSAKRGDRECGENPFAVAGGYGHLEVMKLLHKWGTQDVDAAFWEAMDKGQTRAIRLARKLGARQYLQYYLMTTLTEKQHRKLAKWIRTDGNAPLVVKHQDVMRGRRIAHEIRKQELAREAVMLELAGF